MHFQRLVLVLFASAATAVSQSTCGLDRPAQCIKDVGHDQAGIWASPLHAKRADALWLLPLASATALAFRYDTKAQNTLGVNQTLINRSNKIANFGSPYATVAGGGAIYLTGLVLRNRHLSETGRLSVEAIVDTEIVVEAIKITTNRERPLNGGPVGFWPNGTNSSLGWNASFPSGHASASWAIARVVASEYPKNKPLKIAAYAFATTISAVRVTGRAHFPSDVVIGSALGYLIGGYVLHHHAAERLDSTP